MPRNHPGASLGRKARRAHLQPPAPPPVFGREPGSNVTPPQPPRPGTKKWRAKVKKDRRNRS